jgi:N-acetylmuramoyl-L-alanine amidase
MSSKAVRRSPGYDCGDTRPPRLRESRTMAGRIGLADRRRLSVTIGLAIAAVALLYSGFACAATTAATTTTPTAAASTSTLASATTTPSSAVEAQTTTSVAPAPTTTASSPQTTQTSVAGDGNGSVGPVPVAGPLIVLDPGHSGTSLTTIDPATQIRDEEYLNTPETRNMFEVAVLLKAKLEAAGYTVLMTKKAWNDTVSKRDRVNFANDNHAALGVSIHTSGHTFGNYGQIYVQRMDSYRENIHGKKVFFALPDVAALSARYGQIFLAERRKIEGSSVVITVNTGWGARGLAPGNLPIVQLFSEVPWILNEAGVPRNATDKDRYAQSLFNAIVKCVPIGGAA